LPPGCGKTGYENTGYGNTGFKTCICIKYRLRTWRPVKANMPIWEVMCLQSVIERGYEIMVMGLYRSKIKYRLGKYRLRTYRGATFPSG
jgi:hypothetical protein